MPTVDNYSFCVSFQGMTPSDPRLAVEPDPFPRPAPPPFVARVAARTDVGRERSRNEDRAAFVDLTTGRVHEPPEVAVLPGTASGLALLVCDGMGGEAGGQIASSLAAESIVGALRALHDTGGFADDAALARACVKSIEHASAQVRAVGRAEPRYARMGTTATLVALGDRAVVCAQVGDSRAYLWHEGTLLRLTRDQTFLELLRSQGGALVEGEGIGANVILQAVGSTSRLDVVLSRATVTAGDAILVCSDGLHGVVSDARIGEVLARTADPERAADLLVAAALEGGGPDNVSCVVARLVPPA